MKIGMFASLLRPPKGRPPKEGFDTGGVGQPPWLPTSQGDIAIRRRQLKCLRANLRLIPSVQKLPASKQRAVVRRITVALDTWRMSKDAVWHHPKILIGGSLGIAAEAAGESAFRPECRPKRGRKPNVADVRFLMDCADAWAAVGGNSRLSRLWGASERLNQRLGTSSTVLSKPLAVRIADTAWQCSGRTVPDTTWPGLIDNARRAILSRRI
jgi:hypothetical protein